MEISKKDWLLFRELLPRWQENYMDRLNHEYITLLSGAEKASEKFWALEKRIKNDRRHPGVILELKKENVVWDLARFVNDGVITLDELEGFSDALKERVIYLTSRTWDDEIEIDENI